MKGLLLLLLLCSFGIRAHDHGHDHNHDHDHGEHDHQHEVFLPDRPAHPVVPQDLLKRIDFLETFQDGPKALEKGWVASSNERYFGHEWTVGLTFGLKDDDSDNHQPGFKDDQSLSVNIKHKHYGLTHMLSQPFDNTGKTLVFQYEVRFHDGVGCSGAYAKLLLKQEQDNFDPLNLEEATPYVVMFGPDRCGATNKVHFIVRQKLPNGQYEEKHLSKTVTAKTQDAYSHLYTLIIRPDNSYSVKVDEVEEASGFLTGGTDFTPPFGAPKEIDDPQDFKPKDWVDTKKIPDPNAKKPEDWNEDAPKTIPDPDAKKPEDWNDDEDGEWEAPQIPNPEFKGKWQAPMIDNPAYKGEWKAKKIPNPNFFEDPHPSNLEPIIGIAFEILANDRGIAFDNILLSHDEKAAEEYAALTFQKKNILEKSYSEAIRRNKAKKERLRALEEDGPYGMIVFAWGEVVDVVTSNPIKFVVSILVLLFSCIFYCCFLPSPQSARKLNTREAKVPETIVEEEEENDLPVEAAKNETKPAKKNTDKNTDKEDE